jgi:hypothetical protein
MHGVEDDEWTPSYGTESDTSIGSVELLLPLDAIQNPTPASNIPTTIEIPPAIRSR